MSKIICFTISFPPPVANSGSCHHHKGLRALSSQMTDFPSGERQQSIKACTSCLFLQAITQTSTPCVWAPHTLFCRYSLIVQVRWLKEAHYYNDCALKGLSAILYKSIVVHSGDPSSLTGSGLSHDRAVKNLSCTKVFQPVRAGVGVLLRDRAWQLAVTPLLQVEAWHYPNLKEDALVITCRGRGSRVTTGPPQPVYHMTTQLIGFTCRKCGKLLVSYTFMLAYHSNMIRDAKTIGEGKINLLAFVIVLPQEVLLFPAMKPDDNKTSAPAEGTSVWSLLLSSDLCRNSLTWAAGKPPGFVFSVLFLSVILVFLPQLWFCPPFLTQESF